MVKKIKEFNQKMFLNTLKVDWSCLYGCLSNEKAFGVLNGQEGAAASNEIDENDVVRHIESF